MLPRYPWLINITWEPFCVSEFQMVQPSLSSPLTGGYSDVFNLMCNTEHILAADMLHYTRV